MKAYLYQVQGLRVVADIELPELQPCAHPASAQDVEISAAAIPVPPAPVPGIAYRLQSGGDVIIQWNGCGRMRVEDGYRIRYEADESVDPVVFRQFVICHGLAAILKQRGVLVLHASAVEMKGQAVGFVGRCGEGKSTIAAVACSMGAKLLTDDVMAVDAAKGRGLTVSPGWGLLKLTSETLDFIGAGPSELTLIEGTRKSLYPVGSAFSGTCVPLKRIYVLENHPSVQLEVPPAPRALQYLMEHSFAAVLLPHLGAAPGHLRQCATLVSQGKVKILKRPRDLGALRSAVARVEEDL